MLSMLILAGCQTPPRVDQVKRMLAHPQLPLVQKYCPAWGREALTIINDQQLEIEKLKIK